METAGRTHVDRTFVRHGDHPDSGGAVSARNRQSLQKNSRIPWGDVVTNTRQGLRAGDGRIGGRLIFVGSKASTLMQSNSVRRLRLVLLILDTGCGVGVRLRSP